jgi:Fic family protein
MKSVNNPQFRDIPLRLYDPAWGSALANTVIELEKLRVKKLGGPVPPYIFFQIKNIFQILESLGSARIEGNHTTLPEFVEKIIDNPSKEAGDEKDKEIFNIEKAIDFIETNVSGSTKIDRPLVSEIHKILVDGLTPPPRGEGSRFPGKLRTSNVAIGGSNHRPPDAVKVPEYFDQLLDFVNRRLDTQYHLLAIALSHHRMAWIHPFDNGNGRLVRMFTYALLIKQGFQVKSGRILNPTAVFCMDRDRYYDKLALADSGTPKGALEWCLYVLDGLRVEIEKIDRLLDLPYIVNSLLLPTLSFAFEHKHVTELEHAILSALVRSKGMSIKSADLEKVIGRESPVQRSRIIRRLKDKGMLVPLKEKGRVYTIGFANTYLLRGVMHVLERNGFIPESLNRND